MLLHLGVVCRRNAIQVSRDLSSQVGNHHKLLQDVFRQDVSVAGLLDIVRRHIDVICPQVEVGRRDGPHPPLGFAGKGVSLVVACC